jgi:hypothetical protein
MTAPAFASPPFTLERSPLGHLVHVAADGRRSEPCVPVRAFPLHAPDDGLSIVGPDGHELAWVDRVSALPEATRTLIEEDLRHREFTPVIRRQRSVSTFSTPSTWDVETDRGDTRLVLEVEENIRRLGGGRLLIGDARGVHFLVPDRFALDKGSRRLLERFL